MLFSNFEKEVNFLKKNLFREYNFNGIITSLVLFRYDNFFNSITLYFKDTIKREVVVYYPKRNIFRCSNLDLETESIRNQIIEISDTINHFYKIVEKFNVKE